MDESTQRKKAEDRVEHLNLVLRAIRTMSTSSFSERKTGES